MQDFDGLASIGKLNFRRLSNIKEATKTGHLENSKFLQFCLLDILNFKNLNK